MSVIAPPEGAERGDPEALIEEAWERARRRRRRQRVVALGGLVMLAIVASAWVALSDGGKAGRGGGARSPGPADGGGSVRYLYTRSFVAPPAHAILGSSVSGATIENWVGSDGSWRLRETVPGRAPGSIDVIIHGDGLLPPQANAGGAFNGVPINARDPGDGLFTARELASLPRRAPTLRARLEQAVTAQELRNLDAYVSPGPHRAAQLARLRPVFLSRRTTDMLFAIADLEMSPLPRPLPAAFYRVARALPTVRVTAARDGLGRPGVEVEADGLRLIFDPRSGALRSSTMDGIFDQGTAGTILAQGAVPDLDTIPRGLTPIRSPVPRPPRITLAPATGTRATTLTLRIATTPIPTTAHRAPALTAEMFGPTGPNCIYWNSRPPVARIPTGTITTRHHVAIASYRITPGVIGRRAWCPGRYQLMLTPLLGSPARRVAVPRSFAAAYFIAR